MKQEDPLESNRLRIYKLPMVQVFLVIGGALSMEGSNIFPEGCYFRGAKVDDDGNSLLMCVSHMSWEPIVDGQIPIFELGMSSTPPPEPEKKKTDLLLL